MVWNDPNPAGLPLPESNEPQREVLSRTHFKRAYEEGNNEWQWRWHTKANNGEIVADSAEGYDELRKCVGGFWVSQGVDPENASLSSDYSKLEKYADDHYVIIHYAPQEETPDGN